MSNNKEFPMNAKMDPDLSTQRLPSLKPPRDLSLSSFSSKFLPNELNKKKVYTPNLNVQRNKQKRENIKKYQKESKASSVLHEKRKKKTYIQVNIGLFSEGPTTSHMNMSRSKKVGGGVIKNTTEKDVEKKEKLDTEGNQDVNKEEENLKDQQQEEAVEDPKVEKDSESYPVRLPRKNNNSSAIETEPAKLSDINSNPNEKPCEIDKKESPGTLQQILDCKEPFFTLLQVPLLSPGSEAEISKKMHQGSDGVVANSASTKNNITDEAGIQSTLQNLKPGKIGSVQILKSGKTCLIIGKKKFYIDLGTQASFKQDLVSHELDKGTKTGNTINLGPVSVRMVLTPDLDELVTQPKMS